MIVQMHHSLIFSLERMTFNEGSDTVLYRGEHFHPTIARNLDAKNPLEWIARITSHIPKKSAPYRKALQNACEMIDGFQSPLGLELLATVDWLLKENEYPSTVDGIRQGLKHWPESKSAADRKQRIFIDRLIDLALKRLLPLSS